MSPRNLGLVHMASRCMSQKLVRKETGFYSQDSNLRGAGNTPAQSPVLQWNPALPLLLSGMRLQAKSMPKSSPYPYLFLSQLHK